MTRVVTTRFHLDVFHVCALVVQCSGFGVGGGAFFSSFL
jgi:hypothetical protein